MYSIKSRVRFSETGLDGQLSLMGMLNLFQDCAVQHGQDVGLAYTDMLEEGLAWVLMSYQIELHRMPALSERIETVTNPYRIGGFTGLRNFWINDAAGERLCLADSIWALININTGRPSHVRPDYGDKYGLGEKVSLGWRQGALRLSETAVTLPQPIDVQSYMLDTNGHVNNAWYPRLMQLCLPEGFTYNRITVEFKSQARSGDRIMAHIQPTDGGHIVALTDVNGGVYAIGAFTNLC